MDKNRAKSIAEQLLLSPPVLQDVVKEPTSPDVQAGNMTGVSELQCVTAFEELLPPASVPLLSCLKFQDANTLVQWLHNGRVAAVASTM